MTPYHARLFPGNYDYYKEKIAEEEAKAAGQDPSGQMSKSNPLQAASSDLNQKEQRREKAKRRNELAPEKRRLEKEVAKLEKVIEQGEAAKAALIEKLSNPTPETDFSG